MPSRMRLGGHVTEDDADKCELFDRHLGSGFSAPASTVPEYYYFSSPDTLCIVVNLTPQARLDGSRRSRPDNFPP